MILTDWVAPAEADDSICIVGKPPQVGVEVFILVDPRPPLGEIVLERRLDGYMYVYPDSDETRRVVNKIGGGLGLTWTVAWDGEAIWRSTPWGDVYRLDPQSGAILKQSSYPGPQMRGMTFDGELLWINDFVEKRDYGLTTEGRSSRVGRRQTGPAARKGSPGTARRSAPSAE